MGTSYPLRTAPGATGLPRFARSNTGACVASAAVVDVTEARFEELVGEALDRLPPEFARAMSNVVVLVEDEDPRDPDLLGLYTGVALTDRDHSYGGHLPDRITLYRRPLQSICSGEAELAREIAVTVVHEVAHHFGIDDARLHALGWG